MIRIAAPVATVKAITKAQARAEVTTREVTTRAAQTREADANVTTAKRSLTRMGEHTEPAEGRITPGAIGAIQLGGETLDVVTCSLLKGIQTTPGPTELVHTAGSSSHVWFSNLTLTSDLPQIILIQ